MIAKENGILSITVKWLYDFLTMNNINVRNFLLFIIHFMETKNIIENKRNDEQSYLDSLTNVNEKRGCIYLYGK